MKKKIWNIYAFWIVLMILTGLCGWWIVRDGIGIYQSTVIRPSFVPPAGVFYVAWGMLYVLMGVSVARIQIAPKTPEGERGTNHFIIQLVLNFFWGQIFFNSRSFGFAFVWLVALLVFLGLMIRDFYKADRLAAWLQAPYLLWCLYAVYLNCSVWMLNK